ncbi:hypothetical protein pdam_00013519 [Pocillopora damicornis]|uniref:Uncharacterized protein n=1 Tax=Pocillopora damicornis TaxID=46731 RepID=A0A3M6TD09_POCDA|nr:hypothetical protein pdam_00013519 [Pocillopora damicornis]
MSDDSSAESANDLITVMFHPGYRYDVIVHLLGRNGYKIYLRTLKRRLIDLELKRKEQTEMDESEIELLIRREVEGYDKLKPYGFPIHGCIYGYSKRVLWLEAVKSNTDPKVPEKLYLDIVQSLKVVQGL